MNDGGAAEPENVEEVELGPLFNDPPIEEGPARKVEKTRATLAYLLFGLLAGVLLMLLILLAIHRVTVQQFDSAVGVVVAPVVALLGAATGYYYGKGER
jgi:uncharacterized integral membrane protein